MEGQVESATERRRRFTVSVSPLPSANELERLDSLGFAREVIDLTKQEQQERHEDSRHHREMENREMALREREMAVEEDIPRQARRTHWMFFILALVGILACLIIALSGHPWVGGPIIGVILMALSAARFF
ncbi:hypothetical protein [Halorhodospira halophila]|uniref:hypothetical protein n=1 Tax=Halorhodospira halophila TaxID=1053 RepID=UPI001911F7F6|nr:hypothetical protein [Halorhodospira halophila]MBK5935483.1 hypothetical protein [Halorhodospira halophila]